MSPDAVHIEILLTDPGSRDGRRLTSPFVEVYGEWTLPLFPDRPWVMVNFVASHDGRVSYALPDAMGGGSVAGHCPADTWLMGLSRARADAVMVGDSTLRIEPEHIWTPRFIHPSWSEEFTRLREHDGLRPEPLQVFLSLDGRLPDHAAVYEDPTLEILVVTTTEGRRHLSDSPLASRVEIMVVGDERVDPTVMMAGLRRDHGVSVLLCEGGPRVYGSLLGAGVVDEVLITRSPLVIGASPDHPRPSLVEGVAFEPGTSPRVVPRMIGRSGDHLLVRHDVEWPHRGES